MGFRAIADKAAQLPAILHEIEGHGTTGELKLPELVSPLANNAATSLPAKMKSGTVRAAFDLVSSLHFIGDQTARPTRHSPDSCPWSMQIVGLYISSPIPTVQCFDSRGGRITKTVEQATSDAADIWHES